MDLNILFHRHQMSLMRAAAAICAPSRIAHEGLTALYADAIADHQRQNGGSFALLPTVVPSR